MSKTMFEAMRDLNIKFERHVKVQTGIKAFEDLTLMDGFMFCQVFSEYPNLCKRLLESILCEEISEIIIDKQHAVASDVFKDVRLDVFVQTVTGAKFDIEMQNRWMQEIPRRMRYYQGMIDNESLGKGDDYSKLPETKIIFITRDDIIGNMQNVYRFKYTSCDSNRIVLEDGTEKIIVCAKGNYQGITDDLRSLLLYMTGESVEYSEFTEEVDKAIREVKQLGLGRSQYMSWSTSLSDAKREAREEGREEGVYHSVKALVESGMSIEEVFSRLGIQEDSRVVILKRLGDDSIIV